MEAKLFCGLTKLAFESMWSLVIWLLISHIKEEQTADEGGEEVDGRTGPHTHSPIRGVTLIICLTHSSNANLRALRCQLHHPAVYLPPRVHGGCYQHWEWEGLGGVRWSIINNIHVPKIMKSVYLTLCLLSVHYNLIYTGVNNDNKDIKLNCTKQANVHV